MNPESNISRWVAFLLGPLVLLASSFIAIKAKAWFNYDLSPAATAAYLFTIIGGIAAALYKWLHNRGLSEIAKTTGLDETLVDHIVSVVEERLPAAPDAPTTKTPASPPTPPAGVGG